METNMEESHETIAPPSNSNVQVVVRVRPLNSREKQLENAKCTEVDKLKKSLTMTPFSKGFTFDFVADEDIMQEEIFTAVGKPITDFCMHGYHCCLLAYGQTGAGKTYTMEGTGCDENSSAEALKHQGLIPRVLQYIFTCMAASKKEEGNAVDFVVRCSYLQIYNEQVLDLLNPSAQNLSIREDSQRGMFVEGLQEVLVSSAEATYFVFKTGAQNRQTGLTAMNEESSRSHSVFTIVITRESQRKCEGGMTSCKTSNFYLVDLAGSERQKHTEAAGVRLKEAGSINKSLSALGNVIKAIVDNGEKKVRHVPYRDSKLTYLLKDALGGNSKCTLIANISPAEGACEETLSTLKFAQRAKLMRNDAAINEGTLASPGALAEENRKLKQEVAMLRDMVSKGSHQGEPQPGHAKSKGQDNQQLQGQMASSIAHEQTPIRRWMKSRLMIARGCILLLVFLAGGAIFDLV